jgi:hypothetical protein
MAAPFPAVRPEALVKELSPVAVDKFPVIVVARRAAVELLSATPFTLKPKIVCASALKDIRT